MIEMVVRTVLTAVLLGAGAVAALLAWRRASGLIKPMPFPKRSLHIRESLSLGKGVRIALLSVEGRSVLIGVTPASVSVLDGRKSAEEADTAVEFDLAAARDFRRGATWRGAGHA